MTRAWQFAAIQAIVCASVSLGITRADDVGTASLNGSEEFFFVAEGKSDDRQILEITGVELTAYEEEVGPAPPVPPAPPSETVPLHESPDAATPSQETLPEAASQGTVPQPAMDAGIPGPGPIYGPGCDINSCAPGGTCVPGGCQNCGDPCCNGCGPIFIQNGWGDVWQATCQNWCNCCPSGLYMGAEATFLAPLDEPTNRVVLSDLVVGNSYSGQADPGLGTGVRTWIGLQCDGWGIRARYWTFGNDNIDNQPVVPTNAFPTLHEAYELQANVFDLELTQRFHLRCWQLDTSFGARYADLERNATVLGYGQLGNGVDVYGLALGANEIEGTGVTASIGGRRNFCECGGWHLFWNLRGSVLWADATASSLTDATAITNNPPGVANSRDLAFVQVDHSETVWITDAQLGLGYDFGLCRCPGLFTFRVGLEYQYWNTGDTRSQSDSFAFLQGGPPAFGGRADASSFSHDGDLDLIGLVMGLNWSY